VNSQIRFRDIVDGLSKTFLVAERDAPDDDPFWEQHSAYCSSRPCPTGQMWVMQAQISTYSGINAGTSHDYPGVESRHPGGANFGFADGHVEFLSEDMDIYALWRMTTRSQSMDGPAWQ